MTTTPTSLPADFAATVARVVADAECLTRMAADGVWSRVSLASAADLSVALLRAGDALNAVAVDGVGVVHTSGALPAGHVSTRRWLEVATGHVVAVGRGEGGAVDVAARGLRPHADGVAVGADLRRHGPRHHHRASRSRCSGSTWPSSPR